MADSRSMAGSRRRPLVSLDASPLPAQNRFSCLPGCGLCCSSRVLVTEAECQRLAASEAGFTRADFLEATSDDGLFLRRQSKGLSDGRPGFCIFLDQRQRCTVYAQRPEHCRTYPYLWTTYDGIERDVDFSCPGLGHGDVVPEKQYAPPPAGTQRFQREDAMREIKALLRAQQRYADPQALFALGERCVDVLAAEWAAARPMGGSSLHVAQARPLFVNADSEAEQAVREVWDGLSLASRDVAALIHHKPYVKRHFGRPLWNTRFRSTGEVALYGFWIAGGTLHVAHRDRGGPGEVVPLVDVGRVGWAPEAIVTRRAYLDHWSKRQLSVRLANNMGLARPLPGMHVATCYLEFLLEIDWRLAVLAPALARANKKNMIDRGIVLEAIRGSDRLLRAWCESARLGVAG